MDLLSPERHPAALAQITFDRFWAEIALGHGPRRDLYESWRRLEAEAGPDAPKTPLALIHYWSVDDFDRARERYAVEEEWYRERGEDLWRAERLAHLSMTELRAGRVGHRAERHRGGVRRARATLRQAGPVGSCVPHPRSHRRPRRPDRARARDDPPLHRESRAGEARLLGGARPVDARLYRLHRRRSPGGRRDADADARTDGFDRGEGGRSGPERAVPHRVTARSRRRRGRTRGARTSGGARAFVPAALDHGDAAAGAGARAGRFRRRSGRARRTRGTRRRRRRKAAVRARVDASRPGPAAPAARHRRAAADTLAEALALFERLGAPTWAEQARAELDRVGLRRAPDELTATERRVAELAASGMTNREIAAQRS